MAMEHKFPRDLHTSKNSKRFTRMTPSVTTDSEHEVLVELDSESDVPIYKARADGHVLSIPTKGRKKVVDRKRHTSTNELPTDPFSEDMLYHLMDQNKVLMDQNKALTRRVELLEPAIDCFPPPPEPPFERLICGRMAGMDAPPHLSPNLAQPAKPKPRTLDDDKIYVGYKDLWDAMGRLLRVVETAAKPSSSGPATTVAKPDPIENDMFGDDLFAAMSPPFPCAPLPQDDAPVLTDALLFQLSKDCFLAALGAAERTFEVNQKSKKPGKKIKSKVDAGKFKGFVRADLVPGVWKALGILRIFLLVFIMVQLSVIGGDVMRVSKESVKSSAWFGIW